MLWNCNRHISTQGRSASGVYVAKFKSEDDIIVSICKAEYQQKEDQTDEETEEESEKKSEQFEE